MKPLSFTVIFLSILQCGICNSQTIESNSETAIYAEIAAVENLREHVHYIDLDVVRWEDFGVMPGFVVQISMLSNHGLAGDMAFCGITVTNNSDKGRTPPAVPRSGGFRVYSVEAIPRNLSLPYLSRVDAIQPPYLLPGKTIHRIAAFRLPLMDESTVFPTRVQVRFYEETRDPASSPRNHTIFVTGRMTDRRALLQLDGRKNDGDNYQSSIEYTRICFENAKEVSPFVNKLANRSFTRQYFEFLISYQRIITDNKLSFEDVVRQVTSKYQKLDSPLREYVTEPLQSSLRSDAYERGFELKEYLIQKPD